MDTRTRATRRSPAQAWPRTGTLSPARTWASAAGAVTIDLMIHAVAMTMSSFGGIFPGTTGYAGMR